MSKKQKGTIEMSDNGATAEVNAWLTLSLAADYMGITKQKVKAIIESPRNSAIFNADTVKVTHFHPEVPDLIQIDRTALDAYTTAKAAGMVGNRATRAGRDRKWVQYLPDARITEYQELMSAHGFSAPVAAYKPRKSDSVAPVEQDSAAPDLVEELIEA